MSIHQAFQDTGKLALWCFMISLLFKLFLLNQAMKPIFLFDRESYDTMLWNHLVLSMITRLWLITGIVLVAKVLVNKEPKDLIFKVAAIGLSILLLLELAAIFLSFTGI